MSGAPEVFFAGGGTGGHVFPNVAVAQRLSAMGRAVSPRFVVSTRPIDAQVLEGTRYAVTPVAAVPFTAHPLRLPRFLVSYRRALGHCRELIARYRPAAVIATGGFVSGPVVKAAAKAGVSVALVNLDAVPGRANRWCARDATAVFSVYPVQALKRAQRIGLPLRDEAREHVPPEAARRSLGLDPQWPTLLVTAGSQGASTINRMMIELVGRTQHHRTFEGWQLLHLAGRQDVAAVRQAYAAAGVAARVETFCRRMGLAWSAATLAISRAGAGSVAEAWHHATPTIFMPYPFHRDDHQRRNAEPLVTAGGAMLVRDRVEAIPNVAEVAGPMVSLMTGEARRAKMREAASATRPIDGADVLAKWLVSVGAAG